MKLSQFKFKLPEDKIALHPAKYRDESRLMVVHKSTGKIEHKVFKDILDYFDDKDVFILMIRKFSLRVCMEIRKKTGARIEVFLLRELNEELRLWDVLVDPARKIRIGNKLYFGDDDPMVAEVIDNTTSHVDVPYVSCMTALTTSSKSIVCVGRGSAAQFHPSSGRRGRYRTFPDYLCQERRGCDSSHCRTSFQPQLMKRMEIKGIDFAFVTMHAGLGNFREIDVEDLTKHKMDSEQMYVNADACRIVNNAKDEGKNICAVGTTVMRTIETV